MTVESTAAETADSGEPGAGRIVLVLLSPRVGAGMLTHAAWAALSAAEQVLSCDPDPAWLAALDQAGVVVRDVGDLSPRQRAGELLAVLDRAVPADGAASVAWFGSPDGDPGLTDALASELARRASDGPPPEVELITGSYDLPGSRLLDLVAVMDRLRSPGGCPWDAQQTHDSLMPYLLEESHEVLEAIEALPAAGAREHLTEELGDLLLQVVFHARIAAEDPEHPFDIDDVAGGIVAKLVNRHPHVFADVEVDGADEVTLNWEKIKQAEKQREGLFDGIPASLPALARAQKMLSRLASAGHDPAEAVEVAIAANPGAAPLLRAVLACRDQGMDAEAVLRGALAQLPSQ